MNNQTTETITDEQSKKPLRLDNTKASSPKTTVQLKESKYKDFSLVNEEDSKYYNSKQIKLEKIILK